MAGNKGDGSAPIPFAAIGTPQQPGLLFDAAVENWVSDQIDLRTPGTYNIRVPPNRVGSSLMPVIVRAFWIADAASGAATVAGSLHAGNDAGRTNLLPNPTATSTTAINAIIALGVFPSVGVLFGLPATPYALARLDNGVQPAVIVTVGTDAAVCLARFIWQVAFVQG